MASPIGFLGESITDSQICLGSGNMLMSEQALDTAQIRAFFQHMGRKAVPQNLWTFVLQPDSSCCTLCNLPDRNRSQPIRSRLSSIVFNKLRNFRCASKRDTDERSSDSPKKRDIRTSGGLSQDDGSSNRTSAAIYGLGAFLRLIEVLEQHTIPPFLQIMQHCTLGGTPEVNDPFPSFAQDPDLFLHKVNVFDPDVHYFAGATPGGIKELQDRPVARCMLVINSFLDVRWC